MDITQTGSFVVRPTSSETANIQQQEPSNSMTAGQLLLNQVFLPLGRQTRDAAKAAVAAATTTVPSDLSTSDGRLWPDEAWTNSTFAAERPTTTTTTNLLESNSPLLLLLALLVLINLIVIFGNILVIVAVHATAKLRTATNIFIVSLATADLMLGLLVLPYALMYEILDTWTFGDLWCRGWLVTDVWISTASILNLCAISVDRYVAVTRPVKYRSIMTPRKAKTIVAMVWIVSFLICFPPLLPQAWKSSASSPSLPMAPTQFDPPTKTGGDSLPAVVQTATSGPGQPLEGSQRLRRQRRATRQEIEPPSLASVKPPRKPLIVLLSLGDYDDDEEGGEADPSSGSREAPKWKTARNAHYSLPKCDLLLLDKVKPVEAEAFWLFLGGEGASFVCQNDTEENIVGQLEMVIDNKRLSGMDGSDLTAAAEVEDEDDNKLVSGFLLRLYFNLTSCQDGAWADDEKQLLDGKIVAKCISEDLLAMQTHKKEEEGAEEEGRNGIKAPRAVELVRESQSGMKKLSLSSNDSQRSNLKSTTTSSKPQISTASGDANSTETNRTTAAGQSIELLTGGRPSSRKSSLVGKADDTQMSKGPREERQSQNKTKWAKFLFTADWSLAAGGSSSNSAPAPNRNSNSNFDSAPTAAFGPNLDYNNLQVETNSDSVSASPETKTRQPLLQISCVRSNKLVVDCGNGQCLCRYQSNPHEQAHSTTASTATQRHQGALVYDQTHQDEPPRTDKQRAHTAPRGAPHPKSHPQSDKASAKNPLRQPGEIASFRATLRWQIQHGANKTKLSPCQLRLIKCQHLCVDVVGVLLGPAQNGQQQANHKDIQKVSRADLNQLKQLAHCAGSSSVVANEAVRQPTGDGDDAYCRGAVSLLRCRPTRQSQRNLNLPHSQDKPTGQGRPRRGWGPNRRRPPPRRGRLVKPASRVKRHSAHVDAATDADFLPNKQQQPNKTTTNPPQPRQQLACSLFDDKPYVIYSSLGSFYIPMLVMIFFYSRIYLVASRAQRALQRGYMTTKWPARGVSLRGGSGARPANGGQSGNFYPGDGRSSEPERVTLRIHRRDKNDASASPGGLKSSVLPATAPPPPVTSQQQQLIKLATQAAAIKVESAGLQPVAARTTTATMATTTVAATDKGQEVAMHFELAGQPATTTTTQPDHDNTHSRHRHKHRHHCHHHHHHHRRRHHRRRHHSPGADTGSVSPHSRRHRHHTRHHQHHHNHTDDDDANQDRHCNCRHHGDSCQDDTQVTNDSAAGANPSSLVSEDKRRTNHQLEHIVEEQSSRTSAMGQVDGADADAAPKEASGQGSLATNSVNSVQITVSHYEESSAALSLPQIESTQLDPMNKYERSSSVDVQAKPQVGLDLHTSNLKTVGLAANPPVRTDRSHSCGPAPTIIVSWNASTGSPESQLADRQLVDDVNSALVTPGSPSSSRAASAQENQPTSVGSGLSLFPMAAANQVRKSSMMLLSTLTSASTQTLRRLSTVASHPVESLLKRAKSKEINPEDGRNSISVSATASATDTDNHTTTISATANRTRHKKKHAKLSKHAGPKRTLDDYLMAVAGIDSSSDDIEETGDDIDLGEDEDEEDESHEEDDEDLHTKRKKVKRKRTVAESTTDPLSYSLLFSRRSILTGASPRDLSSPHSSSLSTPSLPSPSLQPLQADLAATVTKPSKDKQSVAAESAPAPDNRRNEVDMKSAPKETPSAAVVADLSSKRTDGPLVDIAQEQDSAESPSKPPSVLHRQGACYERATSRSGAANLADYSAQIVTSDKQKLHHAAGKMQQANNKSYISSQTVPSSNLTIAGDQISRQKDAAAACATGGGAKPAARSRAKRTSRWHAKRLHAETKAAKTVAIIVGGFIFCWLPFFTAYLSRAIICETPECIPQSLFSLFIWLGYLNSAINPIIYGLFSADFRHAFKNIVCRCRLRNADDTAVVSVLVDSIIKSIL